MEKVNPRSPLNHVLGRNMRVYRAAQGLSQEELAERSGIKRTYIGAIERGDVDPRLGTLSKIATGLDLDAFKLLIPTTDQLSAVAEAYKKSPMRP